MDGVFIGSEATVAGRLTRHELRRWYRLLFRGVYLRKDTTPALRDRTTAAWLASRRHGVIAGLAASALHGAQWVDADVDIELIAQNTRAQPGLIVRDETLADDEVTKVAGLPVTTPARTAYDLARHLPRGNAVARLDALARATPFSTEDVLLIAKHHQGARGSRRLRTVLPLVDAGAASPKETWLRLLLVDAGLPTPTTQIPVRDRRYWPFAWLDLGWEDYKMSAEYDGEHHQKDRAQYVKDHQCQRKLERLGWINIQVINEDNPQETIHRVTQALHARGWRP
ncbi:hypothetical protein [Mycolicibacter heraklionensis]|uniref:hypothetical protein n=1 Tax=Mycolicibacter heraklionensis TaxID=512402 RepID=UPI0007EF35FB|nr:hypothetical protein [Mycolicibacter heraklionensis]OBJ32660.1 hypothetical protein A5631_08280 [Mycolicibacter heraklionensis]